MQDYDLDEVNMHCADKSLNLSQIFLRMPTWLTWHVKHISNNINIKRL